MKADDLLAAVFPAQVACQENVTGPIELPDHPLVRQTVYDCLHEAIDLEGLRDVLERIERKEIRLHARDTVEPSPFTHEMLNSKPYTYLDDAPLEERRARAVTLRRTLPESSRDLGQLDDDAIARVREEAWPQPRDAEELHDALLSFVVLRARDAVEWQPLFDELVEQHRAATFAIAGERFWFAAEHLRSIEALYPDVTIMPSIALSSALDGAGDEESALIAMLRGHMDSIGPITVEELAYRVGLKPGRIASGLARLEGEGSVLRGRFRRNAEDEEWCDRRLLARIHRYTLDRLRQEIEPVSAQDFLRFLLRWQHIAPGTQLEGKRGLLEAIAQLQGFEAPAAAWERHLLPARVREYRTGWLDELCLSGDASWARLSVRKAKGSPEARAGPATPAAASSATLISMARRTDVPWLMAGIRNGEAPLAPEAGASSEILTLLREQGALFYDDIASVLRRLPSDVERGLWELVAAGLVTADGFQALRSLMAASRRRTSHRRVAGKNGRRLSAGVPAGRWSLVRTTSPLAPPLKGEGNETPPLAPPRSGEGNEELAQQWAEQLLFRYGVVFRDMVQRESLSIPWRDVLRALRRMEARGVIRGGRFVAGFYGEQYARPEAVDSLRRARRADRNDDQIHVSAVDPLNLAGILTPGARIPAVHTKGVLFRDGLPAAV
jgi:ATP-dependent Lhr-like helicase